MKFLILMMAVFTLRVFAQNVEGQNLNATSNKESVMLTDETNPDSLKACLVKNGLDIADYNMNDSEEKAFNQKLKGCIEGVLGYKDGPKNRYLECKAQANRIRTDLNLKQDMRAICQRLSKTLAKEKKKSEDPVKAIMDKADKETQKSQP